VRFTAPDASRAPSAPLARLLAAALVLSCGGDGGTEPSGPRPATILATPDAAELDQADSLRLEVSVLDENDELLTGIAVRFASSDASRVTVSNTGMIRSVGAAGDVVVAVSAGSGSREITLAVPVTVRSLPSAIEVSPDPVTVPQGGTVQLDVTVRDPFGEPIEGAPVGYQSLNPVLFTVSGTGQVIAGTGSGGGVLRVTTGAIEKLVPVAVAVVPTAILVTPVALNLFVGGTGNVAAVVTDAGGNAIVGLVPVLESSNPGALSLSTAGVATGLAAGTGTITATYGGLSASIPFAVTVPGGVAGRAPIAGPVYGVAVSSAGTVYAAALGVGIARGQLPDFGMEFVLTFHNSYAAAFDPSGASAYVTGIGGEGYVSRLDPATSTVLATSPVLPSTIFTLVMAPDGSRLFAGVDGGYVVALDPVTLDVIAQEQVQSGYANHLAMHPTANLLYVSSPGFHTVFELDRTTLAITRSLTLEGQWQGLAVAPDGSRLYVANEAGALQTWDLATGTAGPAFPAALGGFGLAISPDGGSLWMTRGPGEVLRINAASGTLVTAYPVGGEPRRVAVHPDGSVVAVANQNGWVDFLTP
jgi:streptogramin lyase